MLKDDDEDEIWPPRQAPSINGHRKRALGVAEDSGWDTDDDHEGPGYPSQP